MAKVSPSKRITKNVPDVYCFDCNCVIALYPASTRGTRRCHSCAAKAMRRTGSHDHLRGALLSRLQIQSHPSTVRQMIPAAAAWIGAMIEGEGNFSEYPPGKQGRTFPGAGVTIHNTSVETIATCLRLVGDGRVSVVFPKETPRRPLWRWYTAKHLSMYALLPQIIPFLTSKQERAQRILKELQDAADVVVEVQRDGTVELLKDMNEERS